jgi:tetratricopeptide (TPR) repeat protein
MAEPNNKYAFDDLNFAFHKGVAGFYLITASHPMQGKIAAVIADENVAVYDYSFQKNINTFSAGNFIGFIEENIEKDILFILNFQVPFIGQEIKTTNPAYFGLNMCRDVVAGYRKKIFFFMTEQCEHNISIAAMDFFDYFFPKFIFDDEEEVKKEQEIVKLDEEKRSIYETAEINDRLNRYRDKIEEYLRIPDEEILHPTHEKSKNYLLVAARDLNNFGELYYKIADYDTALQLLLKALKIFENTLGVEHARTANVYNNIGIVYRAQGKYERALKYHEQAKAIREKVLGLEHPDTAATYNNMALVYSAQGDYDRALEYCGKALDIREKVLGTEHPSTATTYNNMAAVYDDQGDYDRALEYYGKALDIFKDVLGEEHPSYKTVYKNMEIARQNLIK